MRRTARRSPRRPCARFAAAALVAALAAACASAQPPPGGEEDERPPRIVEVSPEPLAPLTDLDRPALFRFDERISERGAGPSVVIVSPRTGRFDVKRGRREIRVEPVGGWRPETVYRIVLLPGVQDLFGNRRTEAAELVFSTGPTIPNTAIAGLVRDRLTGRPVAGALVEAVRLPDSLAWVAVTDSAGFFSIRHAPPAEYRMRAFADANRNRSLDPFEERGEADVVLAVSDTVIVSLALLAPDSTPARLSQAVPEDSLTVRLLFDDHLDPERPLTDVRVALFQLPDTVAVAVDTVLFPHAHAVLRAARDSAAAAHADTAAPAQPAPPPVDEPPAEEAAPAGRPPAAADTSLLPVRELILVPGSPLTPDTRYLVRAEGVVNIHGLPGGGGEAEFEALAPDTVPADTVPADTLAPDTVPPDTVPPTVPPATVPPDTVPPTVPPDTVPPDTIRRDTASPATLPPPAASPDTVPPRPVQPETPSQQTLPSDTASRPMLRRAAAPGSTGTPGPAAPRPPTHGRAAAAPAPAPPARLPLP